MMAVAALGWAAEPVMRDNIDNVRTTLEKLIQTRGIISKEKQEWAEDREIINERIELVQREITSLREKISQAEQSISEADKKRAELLEENETLKSAAEVLKGIVSRLEALTITLEKRLPNPLRDRVKPLSRLLPEDPNQTKLSLGQRFKNVIGILNEVNKFNCEITPFSEVRKLSDGNNAEVTVLYVGLGQAYYVGADGTVAGVGYPSEDGWSWESANDAASRINDAVAIMKNEKVAGFIPLPVDVK
jgi:FtsZ-binding cell division protein ZapB